MASLHPATGTPAAFDPRVFAAPTRNPFLRAETPPVVLRPPNLSALAAETVEVTVQWGTTVLAVEQLTPPRPFAVGEVGGARGAGTGPLGGVGFALSPELLGSQRRELVVLRAGAPFAVLHGGEEPRVLEAGQLVDASSLLVDCSDVAPGARGIELRQGRVVLVEASGITFRLAGSERVEALPRGVLGGMDRTGLSTIGTAAILQGVLIATLAYLTPSVADASMDELDPERLALMQQYLKASAERNQEEEEQKPEAGGSEPGAPAEAAKGPAGKSGHSQGPTKPARLAIQGDSAEPVVSRAELRSEAQSFGMIGVLASLNATNAPSSPWGAELPAGSDAANAHGDLFSRDIGDTFGSGLALSGIGEGGGSRGTFVGLAQIGDGTCIGVTCLGKGGFGGGPGGWGGSRGRLAGTHQSGSPIIRIARDVQVSGRLPGDVIQRIVRQNFGRFRQCYEVGLRSNPNLEGRVTARFVIGRDGAVSNVSAGGDLPDAKVSSCVASAFYGLSFPAPENGIVTVSYPILLTPG